MHKVHNSNMLWGRGSGEESHTNTRLMLGVEQEKLTLLTIDCNRNEDQLNACSRNHQARPIAGIDEVKTNVVKKWTL